MRGAPRAPTTRPRLSAVVRSSLTAFVGVLAVAAPTLWLGLPTSAHLFLIGSFGATAVLLYAAPHVEFAQPRNVLGGHFLAALIGVTAYKLVGDHLGIAAALAVATTIAVMQLTGTMHPPAGATALIAVVGPPQVQALGYRYALTPVLLGAALMVIVALAFNNLWASEEFHYPVYWF